MEPVVAMPAPGGFEVAVLRDARGLWLGSRREAGERFGATLLQERVTITGGPGWKAAGGVLPDGAVRAVVAGASAVEHGPDVWLALVPGHMRSVAVRFEAEDGTLVREPPSGVPVEDATDPCPACAALDWELAGDRVRCRACGHALRCSTDIRTRPTADRSCACRA